MLSDSDLLLLENLTYCLGENNPAYAFGLKTIGECRTVQEFLDQFTDRILARLDQQSAVKYDGENSGAEWAAMIRSLKSKHEICDLRIVDINSKAICFENPQDHSAVVAFRGTNGAEEWIDNVEGLNRADTRLQIEAYDYIESLDYDNITVVGHSKGGNKAMYVAIRSDKVKRCVAYDAQGFSQDFLDKYSLQINENSGNVHCYSLSTDFVHILLYPLPGATFTFVDPGTDVTEFEQNHSADAFFTYHQDNNGHWHILINECGNAFGTSQENIGMSLLHNLVTFIMNNASEQELQELVNLIGPLLSGRMSEGWSNEQIVSYLMQHPEELAILISYVLHFVKLNDLTIQDLEGLFNSLGIDMYEILGPLFGTSDRARIDIIIEKIFKFLTSNEDDDEAYWRLFLRVFGGDVGAPVLAIWNAVEAKYNSINPINNSSNYSLSKIRDYSKKSYMILEKAMNDFMKTAFPNVSSWEGYSKESWYLGVVTMGTTIPAVSSINAYAKKVDDVNRICKKRMNETFDNIQNVDSEFGGKFNELVEKANGLKLQIQQRK